MNKRRYFAVLVLTIAAGAARPAVAAEAAADLPLSMDLLPFQNAIRDQGSRATCPYFAPIEALEAAYLRKGVKVELSPEHLIWLRNVTASNERHGRDAAENLLCSLGGGSGEANLQILKSYGVCRAEDMPYHKDDMLVSSFARLLGMSRYDYSKPFSQFALNRWNFDPENYPPAARPNARYGVRRVVTIAKSAWSPRAFEEVLASGHEIVFGVNIHSHSDDSDKGEPVWRLKPGMPGASLNHVMLMVGYDHARRFFVVKNQWGATNYSSRKDKLAPLWKDVVKYDGYTLIDYNYIGEFSEASYIAEVAPVGSSRFHFQRALGQWQLTFKADDRTVLTGVLCWRHLPEPAGRKAPDLRIGELVTPDGREFRVNGRWEGKLGRPERVALFIDFASGEAPREATAGAIWRGAITLASQGGGSLKLDPTPDSGGQHVAGVDAARISITGELVADKSLLLSITPH